MTSCDRTKLVSRRGKSVALFLTLMAIFLSSSQTVALCRESSCIDVFTDPQANQIVIVATQSPMAPATPHPSPPVKTSTPIPQRSPAPAPSPTPTPTQKVTVKPRPARSHSLPKRTPPRKSIAPVSTPKSPTLTAAKEQVSLSDRITRLLPMGAIVYQPIINPVVQVPVNFMTTFPTEFEATIPILEFVITVHLNARFVWEFGDGGIVNSSGPGSLYPDPTITHLYKSAGRYQVHVKSIWTGTWSLDGLTFPIRGDSISISATRSLAVSKAPTRMVK